MFRYATDVAYMCNLTKAKTSELSNHVTIILISSPECLTAFACVGQSLLLRVMRGRSVSYGLGCAV